MFECIDYGKRGMLRSTYPYTNKEVEWVALMGRQSAAKVGLRIGIKNVETQCFNSPSC